MNYTIRKNEYGGFNIVDEQELVVGYYPIVEDAATRLTEILRPDLEPEYQTADVLTKLRSEVHANLEVEFARRLELNKTDPISI